MDFILDQSEVTEEIANLEAGESLELNTASFTKLPDGTIRLRCTAPPTTG